VPSKTNCVARISYLGAGLLIFGVLSQMAHAHGMSEAEKQAIIEGGNLRYLWLGATHMLSGYDHLAFVFGIIFFLKSFRDIAKYVTAFTVGHSVTLIFATFKAIQINYFLIDAVIGLSVCYIAFANIDGFRKYLNVKPPNMMFMIIGLGLIHGCGLSTRLQQLPLSEDNFGLLCNIISFNVGVELGQVTALALMLLIITAWRRSRTFQTFSLIANYTLILWGGYLFLMQMHGYAHTSNPEELGVATVVSESSDKSVSAIVETPEESQEAQWSAPITISIPARSSSEYKINIAKEASIEYSWETDKGKLFFDFHGEPKGDMTGYFKSYKKDTSEKYQGPLTAPFEGTHGWYWKNSNTHNVVVTLKLKGSYSLIDKP
jgi:hypothetical protein